MPAWPTPTPQPPWRLRFALATLAALLAAASWAVQAAPLERGQAPDAAAPVAAVAGESAGGLPAESAELVQAGATLGPQHAAAAYATHPIPAVVGGAPRPPVWAMLLGALMVLLGWRHARR